MSKEQTLSWWKEHFSGMEIDSCPAVDYPDHEQGGPPLTLNENLPLSYPLIFASLVSANTSLISSNTPVYVAGFDLGVLPIGS